MYSRSVWEDTPDSCTTIPSLPPFPCNFSVWEVNSRVPVLDLKITLGLKFLVPPPHPFHSGTLLTSLFISFFACFSFPSFFPFQILFWNTLCDLHRSFTLSYTHTRAHSHLNRNIFIHFVTLLHFFY